MNNYKINPKIVCLCGSTKFEKEFIQVSRRETLHGNIVLSVGVFIHSDNELEITEEQKRMLDELHKRKIDLADMVIVINVDNYIGESTRSEIEYAKQQGKEVVYLWPVIK